MPKFKSDEELQAFYMILSEGKGIPYLEWVLDHMSEEQQQEKLEALRRYREETGRSNPK